MNRIKPLIVYQISRIHSGLQHKLGLINKICNRITWIFYCFFSKRLSFITLKKTQENFQSSFYF